MSSFSNSDDYDDNVVPDDVEADGQHEGLGRNALVHLRSNSDITESEYQKSLELINRNAEYQIRPSLADKFKSITVKEIIHQYLTYELADKTYSMKESEIWSKNIVSRIKEATKDLGFKRYKLIVQVILGENKGSGVKIGARCLWDADTDNYASDYFVNDTIFCCVIVFGIYCY